LFFLSGMSSIESPVTSVCDAYRRAVYEKDVEAFLGLYSLNARVFDTWGVWSYEGIGERRKVIEEWFSSLGEERVSVTMDCIQVLAVAELTTLSARVSYAAVSASGVELRAMQNRLTWVLRPEGGTWKIAHEHTSVPIGLSDLKGILQHR
jgi:ketosteroid isomerase-like protein